MKRLKKLIVEAAAKKQSVPLYKRTKHSQESDRPVATMKPKGYKQKGATQAEADSGHHSSNEQQMPDARDQVIEDLQEEVQQLKTENRILRQQRPLDFALPKLTGIIDEDAWDSFLRELYEVGNMHGWNEDQYCVYLPRCLEGEMQAVYRLLPKTTRESWHDLLPELAKAILQLLTPAQARQKLEECRQKEDEQPGTYMMRIKRLAERAYALSEEPADGLSTQEQQNRMIVNAFRNGLLPKLHAEAMRRKARSSPIKELWSVLDESRRLIRIEVRQQEHRAFTSRRTALYTLDAETKNAWKAAGLHHRIANTYEATTSLQALPIRQDAHSKNCQREVRYPNSGNRRRIPRKYRIRGARRKYHDGEEPGKQTEEASRTVTTLH